MVNWLVAATYYILFKTFIIYCKCFRLPPKVENILSITCTVLMCSGFGLNVALLIGYVFGKVNSKQFYTQKRNKVEFYGLFKYNENDILGSSITALDAKASQEALSKKSSFYHASYFD